MPIPIPETVDEQSQAAVDKAAAVRSLPRYLLLAGLAGAYVGVAIVLLISVSAPLTASGNAATKLVQGAVFGIALTLVVFAGAELVTGNAMTMLQGLTARRVRAVVPPARHHDQVGRVSEALYRLEPELAESDYTGAFAEVVARYRRRAMLVVLTDLNEQAVADSVLPALPLVTRTHLVVVAAVQDPQVLEWASARPSDPEQTYRQVAAVQALADRRRTTAQLRAMGATVVDAAPGRLGVDVTDAYLLAKSTGRL